MRRNYLAVAAISLCSVFMCGCVASEGDLSFLYSKQREVETTLRKMQKDIDWLKAEVEKKESMPGLSRKTSELENKLLELEQVISKMYAENEERLKKIEAGLSAAPQAGPGTAAPQPETPPAPASGKASESADGKPSPADPGNNYELGLRQFADGSYGTARRLFREHLADAPRSKEAPDAMFLIADSYFKEKLYEEAILEYQNMIETWPASPRIPLCQLNQGIALLEIEKPNEASLFFESLIEAYPDSPEAETAKKHLKTLSGPGG